MAGAGYKLFATGDVLTASDVNTYLMQQTVMVFDDAAARTTALAGVVAEGMLSYLKDTNAVEVYDGANWVASDDPNAIQNTIVDAKGDLISATADNTPARLAVGANETRLIADSVETTGLKYVADTTNFAIAAKGDLLAGTAADTLTALTVGADYTFLQALASAGTTGLQYGGDWTDYTPVVTSASGSFTTTSASGRYLRIGKACIVTASVTITTVGTGVGPRFSLPFTASNFVGGFIGSVREAGVTGAAGIVIIAQNGTFGAFGRYDNAAYQGSGYVYRSTTVYEVA
jgi:hypothetical protein